jgi:hypothetical protein
MRFTNMFQDRPLTMVISLLFLFQYSISSDFLVVMLLN